jgi:hypothetical protein
MRFSLFKRRQHKKAFPGEKSKRLVPAGAEATSTPELTVETWRAQTGDLNSKQYWRRQSRA